MLKSPDQRQKTKYSFVRTCRPLQCRNIYPLFNVLLTYPQHIKKVFKTPLQIKKNMI